MTYAYTELDMRAMTKPKWQTCKAPRCMEFIVFVTNPKTGNVVPICNLHGQNHFRCCTDPDIFSKR